MCKFNGARLLAYDRIDVLFEKLDEENACLYLDRAKDKMLYQMTLFISAKFTLAHTNIYNP